MAVLYLLLSALSWTLFDLARKKLVVTESPMILTLAFNLGTFPLYLAGCLIWGSVSVTSGYWIPGLISALIAVTTALGIFTALKYGEFSRVIPVLALTPVVSTLSAGVFLDESLSVWQWIAMLTVIGAIVGAQGGLHHVRSKSFVLMLGVSVGWGVGTVVDKIALQHAGPFFHGMIQTALVSGSMILFYLIYRQRLTLTGRVFALLPALTLFFLAVVLQWLALPVIDAGVVETVKRSVGIIGALVAGYFVFREPISRAQVFWCLLILAGIPVILQPEL